MARKPKGYSRVDSEDVHGWLVRIKRGDVRKSRFMSDSTYGGKRKSRDAAEKQYEDWLRELPQAATSHGKLSGRNTTGIVGVHFARDTDSRFPNCQYESYIASWLSEDGKRTKLGFSCNRYGADAFELACIAREKRLTDREKVVALMEKRKKSGKPAPVPLTAAAAADSNAKAAAGKSKPSKNAVKTKTGSKAAAKGKQAKRAK
jgi:hypothetical protein